MDARHSGGRELVVDSSEGLAGTEYPEANTEDIEYGSGRKARADMAISYFRDPIHATKPNNS